MRLLVQGVGARIQQQFDRSLARRSAAPGRLVVIGETGLDQGRDPGPDPSMIFPPRLTGEGRGGGKPHR